MKISLSIKQPGGGARKIESKVEASKESRIKQLLTAAAKVTHQDDNGNYLEVDGEFYRITDQQTDEIVPLLSPELPQENLAVIYSSKVEEDNITSFISQCESLLDTLNLALDSLKDIKDQLNAFQQQKLFKDKFPKLIQSIGHIIFNQNSAFAKSLSNDFTLGLVPSTETLQQLIKQQEAMRAKLESLSRRLGQLNAFYSVLAPVPNRALDKNNTGNTQTIVQQSQKIDAKLRQLFLQMQKALAVTGAKHKELQEQQLQNCIIVRTWYSDDANSSKRKILGFDSNGHTTVEFYKNSQERVYLGLYAVKKEDPTLTTKFFRTLGLPTPENYAGYMVPLSFDEAQVGPGKKYARCETRVIKCDMPGAQLNFAQGFKWATEKLQECGPVQPVHLGEKLVGNFHTISDYNFYNNNCSTLVAEALKQAGAEHYKKYEGVSVANIDSPQTVLQYVTAIREGLDKEAGFYQREKVFGDGNLKQKACDYINSAISQLGKINDPVLMLQVEAFVQQLMEASLDLNRSADEKVAEFIDQFSSSIYRGINVFLNHSTTHSKTQNNNEEAIAQILMELAQALSISSREIANFNHRSKFINTVYEALSGDGYSDHVLDEYKNPTAEKRSSKTQITINNREVSQSSTSDRILFELKTPNMVVRDADILLTKLGWQINHAGQSVADQEKRQAVQTAYTHVLNRYTVSDLPNPYTASNLPVENTNSRQMQSASQYVFSRVSRVSSLVNIALNTAVVQQNKQGALFHKALCIKNALLKIEQLQQEDSANGKSYKKLDAYYSSISKELHQMLGEVNKTLYFEQHNLSGEDESRQGQLARFLLPSDVTDKGIAFGIDNILQNAKSDTILLKSNSEKNSVLSDNIQRAILRASFDAKDGQTLSSVSVANNQTIKKPGAILAWRQHNLWNELETQGRLAAILDNENVVPLGKIPLITALIEKNKPSSWKFWRGDERARYEEHHVKAVTICYLEAFLRGDVDEAGFYSGLGTIAQRMDKKQAVSLIQFASRFKEVVVAHAADTESYLTDCRKTPASSPGAQPVEEKPEEITYAELWKKTIKLNEARTNAAMEDLFVDSKAAKLLYSYDKTAIENKSSKQVANIIFERQAAAERMRCGF